MSVTLAFEVARLGVPLQQMADVLTASQKDVFVRLPGLVAYWPCGIRGASGVGTDHSGNFIGLAQVGTCPTGYDGNSFVHLGNVINYLLSPSVALDLTGTETFIDSTIRGLTFGGWFNADATPAFNAGMIGKDGANPQRGYAMHWQVTNDPIFHLSFNGAATFSVTAGVLTVGDWHFIVARFIPSTELAIFADGVKTVNVTAIPASGFVSSQAFEVGRYVGNDARTFHGRARDLFVCASALSDDLIEQVRITSLP